MTRSQGLSGASGALALMVFLALPAGAMAQQTGGSAWLAWTGCWVEVGAPADAPMTCVVPEDDGAALLTVSDEGETERQLLRSDGVERPVDVGGCVGVQAAEVSSDRARVYTRSRLSCEGGSERSTRGLMAMVAPDEWIRVRALSVGEESVASVNRYRPAPASRVDAAGLTELDGATDGRSMAIETARLAAAAAPTVDAIIEASEHTDTEAVRAWIVERDARMRVDADRLIRMADAGVSESVIDVVVAVSYPERFAVDREPRRVADGSGEWGRYGRRGYGARPYYDPFFSPYGYGYNYNYSRYNSWGYPGYHSPRVIVIRPVGNDSPSANQGRAVKGRGYTRPGSSSATPGTRRPSSPPSVRSGGAHTTSGKSGSTSSKGKAKPRGNGGGGN